MNKRILFLDNGTVNEWSVALNNYRAGDKSLSYVSGEDYVYIGSRLPFNNLYFKVKTAASDPVNMTVEYYSTAWTPAVELIDQTAGLSVSGFIDFTPNRDKGWMSEQESNRIPGLESVIIYDQYWMRISFDADFTAELSWIGNIFSDDDDIQSEFPDLMKADTLTSFASGKTNWQEQHVKAAEMIEHDLINMGVLDGSEQILERAWYKNASVQKTAEIIFGSFGDDFTDQKKDAREEYKLRLSKRLPRIDKNNSAIEEPCETFSPVGFLSR